MPFWNIANTLSSAENDSLGVVCDLCCLINSLFKRSYHCGFATQINNIVSMVDKASKDLFGKIMAPYHCLHSIRRPETENNCDLRTRGHKYLLSQCKFNLYRNSFLVTCLSVCLTVFIHCLAIAVICVICSCARLMHILLNYFVFYLFCAFCSHGSHFSIFERKFLKRV